MLPHMPSVAQSMLRNFVFATSASLPGCLLSHSGLEVTMPKASRQEAVLTSDVWAKVLSHLNPTTLLILTSALYVP